MNTFFHPETLQRIERLDLRAKHVVDGFMSGLHQSRHFGNSVEFRQHRQYVPGDDPRSVDWKVWARQDRLYVKQYEVDTNLRLSLLVDVSQSMRFGTGAMTKYEYACTAAVSLAYLALRQQDAVGCLTFDKEITSVLPPKTKQSQLNTIADLLLKEKPRERPPARRKETQDSAEFKSETLPVLAPSLKKNGLVIVFSDLLTERENLFQTLRSLRGCGHDVVVMHILDAMELDFNLTGAARFEGLELLSNLSSLILRCDPRSLRTGYLKALNVYLDEIKQGCALLQCDYVSCRTDSPLDTMLSVYLSKRSSKKH